MTQIVINSVLLASWIGIFIYFLAISDWIAAGIEFIAIVVQTAALVLSLYTHKHYKSMQGR